MAYNKPKPLTVIQKAEELSSYIYVLTSNPKRFPSKIRKTFVYDTQHLSDLLFNYIGSADGIYPDTPEEYRAKLLYLKQALSTVKLLGMNIKRAERIPGIKLTYKQMGHIARYVNDISNMLTSRILGLKDKYSHLDIHIPDPFNIDKVI